MTVEVKVPDIGDFDEVPVVTVLVAVGDTIALEDPIVELESDKATMEVPSSAAGVVKEIKVAEGDKVSEGAVLLIVEASDAPAAKEEPKEEAPAAAPASAALTDAGFSKVHASPSVRAYARRVEVDLNKVNGSGRKGRILREDVEKALKAQTVPAAAAGGGAVSGGMGIPPIPAVDFSKFGPIEEIEMPRIKKISGPALHRSWLNIPHVTHNDEADITDLDKYRKEMDTHAKENGYRVTLLSFVIKASVSALKTHWEFNSSIHPDGDKLIKKDFYNIGFAADTPNGLMVPVIKDADRKGLVDISKELMDLSKAAREGNLKSKDMQGATFTISSLGGIGGTSFTPIVNAPEVAILGLTRSKMAPVWNGEDFVPRLMQPLSLSYDHRAVDGALAARFTVTLKTLLGDMRKLMW
ncbi:dihydrolipoyllysine-residue acetyltransferase component of pyruvate dehydrogenase complex [Antarctobacter heliothermus]|uniref:Dihydrolipoamide acetyltransferase component of pyruvate dehydrogenase complex n=1 Tax=Antarctobacter heliothermus TaxID=74033 RepID=A0A222E188_9RHOB|nr:2-oxo acid dehydrogenase subunit E2 [Antarctobacter heliothermus]ASP19985.1 dihydrolipoyllysine-residue acetyltransferase component of pyruvate dehydrogenase complex [Antarctobacter heliothermus]